MATRALLYGTRTAFGGSSNITSLAANAAKTLQHVDNTTTLALDYLWWLEITLASAGVSATGTVEIYLLEGQVSGSGDTTDGIDMSTPSTADLATSIKNATLIKVLAANAVNQVVRWHGRLLDYVANPANFHSLLIRNLSGAAFAASGHDAQFVSVKESI